MTQTPPRDFRSSATEPVARDPFKSMGRGARLRCPQCGVGRLDARYLKIVDHCQNCGEAFHHHRADDAPAYFTMFIVGHLMGAGALALEQSSSPPLWVHALIWGPLTLLLSAVLLPRVKGALVGLQWANRMHGFNAELADEAVDDGGTGPDTPARP
ncbi:MAG: DUF983 domain-containing protein [Pseudomonadota bacterium]